jgi:hypothetical protein
MRLFKRRLALVVGVSEYEHMQTLPLCKNDAQDMAASLDIMGFDVSLVLDPTEAELRACVSEFVSLEESAHLALIYFSGHGLEDGRRNYLLGRDADMSATRGDSPPGVEFANEFKKLTKLSDRTIGILDTCRNELPQPVAPANPPSRRKAAVVQREEKPPAELEDIAKSATGEAYQADLSDVSEAVVLYAAASGDSARQGRGRHSYFTGALLNYIDIPGLTVADMFGKARDDVIAQTSQTSSGEPIPPQVPWTEQSSGSAPFVLRGRSWTTAFALTGLGLLAYYLAHFFQVWRPLPLVADGAGIYVGLLFSLLVGFGVWRWGGIQARPLLVTALTALVWAALEFLLASPAPNGKVLASYPDFLPATVASVIVLLLIASEVRKLRSLLLLTPAVAVLLVGLILSYLEGEGLVPPIVRTILRIDGPHISGAYYDSGLWIVVFAAGLGIRFQRIEYSKSTRDRRLMHKVASPGAIWGAAVVGLVLGAVAGWSGHPLPTDISPFALPLSPNVNWVPGVAFALTMTFVIWRLNRRDLAQMALSMFILWVLVVWLPNTIPVEEGTKASESNLIASAVILGIGATAMVSLLDNRVWRVPAWTVCLLASVFGLLPYLAIRGTPLMDMVNTMPGASWSVLYGGWLGTFAAAAAFGLSSPPVFDPLRKRDVPLRTTLKHALLGEK